MADYNKKINIKNKRAAFDYEILEEYVAGIVLTGTEISRSGSARLHVDCYCYFDRHELYIRGLNISEYHWVPTTTTSPNATASCCSTGANSTSVERASQDKSVSCRGARLFRERAGTRKW